MNAQIKDLAKILDTIKNDSRFAEKIRFERVEYDSGNEILEAFFKTSVHLPPDEFLPLKQELADSCKNGIALYLDQSGFWDDLYEDQVVMSQYLKDFAIIKQPTLLPFLQNASMEWKDHLLTVGVMDEMSEGILHAMELPALLSGYLDLVYGEKCNVRIVCNETAAAEYAPCAAVKKLISAQKKPENPPRTIAAAKRREETSPVSAKRSRHEEQADAPMSGKMQVCDLRAGEKCTIEGEVVFTEDKELKDGELIKHKFVVCDYSASITCFFLESSKYKTKLTAPKKGQWVVVSGECSDDPFEHEKTVKVQKIGRSSHKEREDTAEVKRVELHTHTQMSAQDGVTDVAKIIKRAAQWGHKAIAITDHGVVQAFPDAANAAKQNGIRVIYGVEAYMIDDSKKVYDACDTKSFTDEYIVFDIETTGLSHIHCDITEIGAVRVVNGELKDRFQTFVRPGSPIPPKIVSLTGITDDMVKDAPLPEQALREFYDFCGRDAVLVAHNAEFDTKFIFHKSKEFGLLYENKVVDSIALCRLAFPRLKNYKLNTVAAHLRIPLDHHRAVNDAICTAEILLYCFRSFEKQGVCDMQGVNKLFTTTASGKTAKYFHTIILCKNKRGLRNLYKLISHAHLDYFYRKPRMPKSLIDAHREGLIIGSACEAGELYRAVLAGESAAKLEEIASFYDYLEIQPVGNNEFLIRNGMLAGIEDIRRCNKKIVELGKKLGKPVVATCDVHFLDPQDEYFRRIIFQVQGYDDTIQPPLYLRTTDEMLKEFSYLGEETAYEVVVENSNKIADMTEEIQLFQSDTAMPSIEGASEKITELAYRTAKERYGDPLPELIEARLKRELDSIVGHGFSVLYYSAHRLVKKSNEDGYLVGSRGSVGSSLAATMTGITEVNPLPPHYVCPKCKHSDFDVDKEKYPVGVDLPDAVCPVCGTKYIKDGYDIPFEVFLGIDADKVPDIDLNFSGEYQPVAHKYTEVLFGKGHVFRAGTISAVKDKIAYGYVKKFLEQTGTQANEAEVNRLVQGVSGVKKTTGQHPGGIVIVPSDREVYEFTPLQRPADSQDAEWVTTHFDFNSMHDILIKLDILGHDVPTIIRLLQDMTGMDPLTIPLDDKPTMELFSGLKPLGIKSSDLLGIQTGTLGIPEFGTKFVRQMLMDTKPTTMSEIIRISGLSHGTDVWLGNAQDLIKAGTCTLREAICTRDDIMNYLVDRGVEKRQAFFIMEAVRKGKVAKNGFNDDMQKALDDAQIAEWFIESCKKIKYMFPKAHAAAYVIMAYRIAYCKVHYPQAFYASYFTVRSGEFDASYVLGGLDDIKKNWQILENKGKTATANEKNMAIMLEVACEMYLRGIHFLPVDLKKSDTEKFLIEDGSLRLPFLSIPKLGANAALKIEEERDTADFLSIEDLRKRAKVSSAVIEEMQKMGTLTGLTETNQLSLFDL
ncbi:MAG: PolC-type DNA polymerase III [Christensenella sp.]|nr:PolC-type DNA polymerase III [Christensenella sp.]